MPTFLVRLWMNDHPGSLGTVATRIGAARGNLAGIEILERGGGRAINELVVEVPDASIIEDLVNEVSSVPGVNVEDVRTAGEMVDPRLDALETASALVVEVTVETLLSVLVQRAHRDFASEWTAAVELDSAKLFSKVGNAPEPAWLAAFVSGSRSSEQVAAGVFGPDDIAWAVLDGTAVALVLGRKGRPFRSRERRQLSALATIAGTRWMEISTL